MPRARISKDGIEIAKSGYDVDTASIGDMLFSSQFTALQLELTGTVSVAGFSGYMSTQYWKGSVTFPSAFPKPPLVMVAGQLGGGVTDQTAAAITEFSDQAATAWIRPIYEIVVTTTGFELYVVNGTGDSGSRPTSWKYWVFRQTLED